MSVIFNKAGEVIRRSRNLAGLTTYAVHHQVVGVVVRDTPVTRTLEHPLQPGEAARRYEVLVQYDDGSTGREFFADWRVAVDWIVARRSWRWNVGPGREPRRDLSVWSDVPGFMAMLEPRLPRKALISVYSVAEQRWLYAGETRAYKTLTAARLAFQRIHPTETVRAKWAAKQDSN